MSEFKHELRIQQLYRQLVPFLAAISNWLIFTSDKTLGETWLYFYKKCTYGLCAYYFGFTFSL